MNATSQYMRPRKAYACDLARYTYATSHSLKGFNMGYSMRPRKKAQAHARSAMQIYKPRKNPK